MAERNSGREAEHYERAYAPNAEHAAYNEAVLFDFGLLNQGEEVIREAELALEKVFRNWDTLANSK